MLVNTNHLESRNVVVQTGTYGEHGCLSVKIEGYHLRKLQREMTMCKPTNLNLRGKRIVHSFIFMLGITWEVCAAPIYEEQRPLADARPNILLMVAWHPALQFRWAKQLQLVWALLYSAR
jgi:hypothetical protein